MLVVDEHLSKYVSANKFIDTGCTKKKKKMTRYISARNNMSTSSPPYCFFFLLLLMKYVTLEVADAVLGSQCSITFFIFYCRINVAATAATDTTIFVNIPEVR